jgi:HSP20 family molecular chaperone IbpA
MLLQDRMNRLFEDATQRRAQTDASAEFERADWTPPSDIYETESGFVIAIDLPGINRDALEIDLDDNRLLIKGTRTVEESRHRSERPRGKFSADVQHSRDLSIKPASALNTKTVCCTFAFRNGRSRRRRRSLSTFHNQHKGKIMAEEGSGRIESY